MQLEAWSAEQQQINWEPANEAMEAQLQLEGFEKHYNQLYSSHKELVTRGRETSWQIVQTDALLFSGTTHQATVCVEEHVTKLELALRKMDDGCGPILQQFKDCLQFHLLQQRANNVCTASLATRLILRPFTYLGNWISK